MLALIVPAFAQSSEFKKKTEEFHNKMKSTMKEMQDKMSQSSDEQAGPGNLVQEHKQLQKNTSQDEIEFRVNRKIKQLELSINGHSTIGNVDIKLLAPKGNTMATIHMENGNYASWSRTVQVEEDHADYIGTWKFIIKTENATGEFTLRANGN
jgi:hypothetical protein